MRWWWWCWALLLCCYCCWCWSAAEAAIISLTAPSTAAADDIDHDQEDDDDLKQEQNNQQQNQHRSDISTKLLLLNGVDSSSTSEQQQQQDKDDDLGQYWEDGTTPTTEAVGIGEELFLSIIDSPIGIVLHRLLLTIARATTMGWPEWLQPHIDSFVQWVNGLLEYWHLGYLEYLVWLLLPIFVVFVLPVVFLFFSYGCVIFLRIYKHRNRIREAYASSVWDGARASIASFWEGVGYLWHGYEIEGLENIPDEGPGMIIAYHGPTPIDLYYVIAKGILYKKRTIHCVADKFVFKIPGWSMICKVFCMTPGTVEDCVATLRQGHLLIIAPGGVREALFSNPVTYELMWGRRLGFAKVVLGAAGPVPIIPMFTENCREAFRTPRWGRRLTRPIYERTRLPICPIYGGFPVKMITHLGKPLVFECTGADPPITAERVKRSVRDAVDALIQQHQHLPGSIWRAMFQRIRAKRTTPAYLDDALLPAAEAEEARKEWPRRNRKRTDREDFANDQQQQSVTIIRDESHIGVVVNMLSPSDKELQEVPLLLPSSSSRHKEPTIGNGGDQRRRIGDGEDLDKE